MIFWGSSSLLMAGFWSQSDTGHLDRISRVRPHAITNTGTALSAGQNVGATCRQSALISEKGSDRDLKKAKSHKQINHIPHLTFKHSDSDSFRFWPVPKSCRGNTVQINMCLNCFYVKNKGAIAGIQ